MNYCANKTLTTQYVQYGIIIQVYQLFILL